MIQTMSFLTGLLGFASYFRYPLIGVGVIFEGPVLMVASGLLYRTGFFELTPLFIAILIGDLVGDVFWYVVGRYFADPILKKQGKFI